MVEMAKIVVNWTGFSGAPGYTNLYFRDFGVGDIDQAIVDGSITKAYNWMSSVASRVPASVTLSISSSVEIIESSNGQLQRFMQGTPPAAIVGTGTGAYSAASGAVVNWYTDGVRNGRRIRGRSFLVPLAGSALDTNGTIADTQLAALRTASNGLITATGAGDFGIWARPTTPGGTDGQWNAVTSMTVPDKVAVLRSRRD